LAVVSVLPLGFAAACATSTEIVVAVSKTARKETTLSAFRIVNLLLESIHGDFTTVFRLATRSNKK
jgi:hypothetical protein